MNRQKQLQLENLVKNTNLIKYTIGLPLLIGVSIVFLVKIIKTLTSLYIDISLHPENIKRNLDYLNGLKKGLTVLWSLNKIEFK